jgi:hypothetical protein
LEQVIALPKGGFLYLIPPDFLRHYPAYKSKQLNVCELARVCDISRTTAYKYVGLLEA